MVDILAIAILVYSVILHEVAHGFAADRLGDPTPRLAGRLTLNPKSHIDPINTIFLPLFLILFDSPVIFGAAKPVPIDPFNFREGKRDVATVALAGPATNILLAVVLATFLKILPLIVIHPGLLASLSASLRLGVEMNLVLAFFNLFPLPPLDGAKVLAGVLPNNLASALLSSERFGFLLLFFLLFFLPQVIWQFVHPFVSFFVRLLL